MVGDERPDAVVTDAAPETVSFASDGVAIAGHLRRPPGPGPFPALVLTGPFTGVKEQVTGTYAAALSERGYVTLAFDHRNFGASDGRPRQHEDSAGKLRDLRDATSFLASQGDVDAARLGCVGICLGGGYALRHSAFDARIAAVAVIAGAFNNPGDMRRVMGPEAYHRLLATSAAVAQHEFTTGDVQYIAAVAPDGGEAAMGGDEPWRYYGTGRGARPTWENRVTRLSLRELVTFDAAGAVDFLAPTPLLVVHGRRDAYCPPEAAQRMYERAGGPKQMVLLDASEHIDLYDEPSLVEPAVEATATFFDRGLEGRV